ncbi:MAG TPA: MgtC/SapB family protein [Candidatus Eisenbacteria bacterium]|nr:MgtC/SapB family protein [Candidatus Eisenbacteria bacterium]
MEVLWDELTRGIPTWEQFARVLIRLLFSAALGAVVGFQREQTGKPAGLRTHMLVALGSTLFVIVPLETGMPLADTSRVVQGIATGIGFIGAGAILKIASEREVHGLTTAAGIWMTSAAGVAVGTGRLGIAALSIAFTWVTLAIVGRFEYRAEKVRSLAQLGEEGGPP